MGAIVKKHLPVVRVSPPEKHCFFGCFDKFARDKSDRYLLCRCADFGGRRQMYCIDVTSITAAKAP